VDVHGYLYYPTWTRLANSAEIGDDRILLQEAVNWEVGQEIVIISSGWVNKNESQENEVRVIKAIDR